MGNTALKQKYETASKTGVLKISQRKLTECPSSLKDFDGPLRVLDLSENRLVSIPKYICNFSSLKQLMLDSNRLTAIPDEVGKLSKLELLSVCNNKLTGLPETLKNLSHLKQIQATDNLLSEFPLVLCGIKQLDVVNLANNKITDIPDGIENLHATELNLNQNQVKQISELISKCPNLKTLRLEENCLPLSAIPLGILTESKVSTLTLQGNLFEMKSFMELEGYDAYMERYTAVKKKMM